MTNYLFEFNSLYTVARFIPVHGEKKMATLYDEQGTEIYAGRGKYSRNARTKIAERAAYVRNDEGNLVVYVPETETPEPQRLSTLDEDARTLKREAQRVAQQLGLGLDEIELRRNTPEGTLWRTTDSRRRASLG